MTNKISMELERRMRLMEIARLGQIALEEQASRGYNMIERKASENLVSGAVYDADEDKVKPYQWRRKWAGF